MIFIGGASDGKKVLFVQEGICKKCGKRTTLTVYMTYMYLSIFFIPIFKWGRKYYAESSCCHTLFTIPTEVGKAIIHKAKVTLTDDDLLLPQYDNREIVVCPYCGYLISERFDFCPKCGKRVKKYLI